MVGVTEQRTYSYGCFPYHCIDHLCNGYKFPEYNGIDLWSVLLTIRGDERDRKKMVRAESNWR
jgi:hypothetical protein